MISPKLSNCGFYSRKCGIYTRLIYSPPPPSFPCSYPKYPSYSLPYALDIHLPAVTHIFYSANCPEEFIAQLHSVKSKMMTPSAKVRMVPSRLFKRANFPSYTLVGSTPRQLVRVSMQ